MPFDGTKMKNWKAVYIINRMLEVFDEGRGWVCGELHSKDKHQHCLLGAYEVVRREAPRSLAKKYMAKAIHELVGGERWSKDYLIVQFNDSESQRLAYKQRMWGVPNAQYKVIEKMLLRARELAQK